MLNHGPTMLLNRPLNYYTGQPNLFYISDAFTPTALPGLLQPVRNVLFPDGISPATELAIMHRLLPTIHMPDFQTYLDVWDTRKTYEVSHVGREQFVSPEITVTAQQSTDCDLTPKYRIQTNTAPIALSSSGNLLWHFRTGSSTSVGFTDTKGVSKIVQIITPASQGTGQSEEIVLIPDRLFAFFLTPSDVLTGAYTFTYQGLIDPTYPLASIAQDMDRVLSDGRVRNALFQPFAPVTIQLASLRFTYDSSTEQTLRFGAALMAMIYQMTRLTVLKGQYNA